MYMYIYDIFLFMISLRMSPDPENLLSWEPHGHGQPDDYCMRDWLLNNKTKYFRLWRYDRVWLHSECSMITILVLPSLWRRLEISISWAPVWAKIPPPKKINPKIWSPDSGHLRAAAVGDTVRATPPTPVSSPVGLRRVQRGPGPHRGRVGVGQQLWLWVLVPQWIITISRIRRYKAFWRILIYLTLQPVPMKSRDQWSHRLAS